MPEPEGRVVAAQGPWGKVIWAARTSGELPARLFLFSDQVAPDERVKVFALLGALADIGDRLSFQAKKFKKLGSQAKGEGRRLWELKPNRQIRFLGDFRPGHVFLIAVGSRKKTDDLRPEDIRRALDVLGEHDRR